MLNRQILLWKKRLKGHKPYYHSLVYVKIQLSTSNRQLENVECYWMKKPASRWIFDFKSLLNKCHMMKWLYIHGIILRHQPAFSKISGTTCSVTIGLDIVIIWITIIITCEGKKRFIGHMKPVEKTLVSGCKIN